MTVRELLARTDSAELSEWVAYLQLEREGDVTPPENVEDSIRTYFGKRARSS